MQHLYAPMAVLLLLGFFIHLNVVVGQPSAVAPPSSWRVSTMERIIDMDNGSSILPILSHSIMSYTTYFGFYTIDGHSFLLAIVISGIQAPAIWSANPDNPVNYDATLNFTREGDLLLQAPVIWSANPDNPVNYDATLNFTREGDLLLHDGNGTMVWSTATKSKSVAAMDLDVSGNLVLINKDNSSVWQSFDHPTDTLVMGQSLCPGMNLSVLTSDTKWPSGRVYLSARWNGLLYSFEPATYMRLFETNTVSTCSDFRNGSFGLLENMVSLPFARSLQFMRLEPDGHLRLYEMQEAGQGSLMVFDVLSTKMNFCDYPMACGDYGVCSKGQCSCPSLSNFKFQNERLPSAGCKPLSSTSCNQPQYHELIQVNNVSYFSKSVFTLLAISTSENVCKQSCLIDCSCKAVVYQKNNNVIDGDGYCLLVSEDMAISFADDSSDHFSVFVKIQGNHSEKRRIRITVVSSIAGFCLILS